MQNNWRFHFQKIFNLKVEVNLESVTKFLVTGNKDRQNCKKISNNRLEIIASCIYMYMYLYMIHASIFLSNKTFGTEKKKTPT